MRETFYNSMPEDELKKWLERFEKHVPKDDRCNFSKVGKCVQPMLDRISWIVTEKPTQTEIELLLREWFCMYHYIQCGRQDYELTDGLAWWLANTDNTDVDCRFVQSPFRTIYVMIPRIFHSGNESGFFDSFFLTVLPESDRCHVIIYLLTENRGKLSFGFEMKYGFSVKHEISRTKREAGHTDFESKFFSFVFNVLLYCTSAEPDESWHPQLQALWTRRETEKKPKRKARLLSEIEKIGKRRILGSKIIISREDREDFKEAFRTGNKKIGKRFMVAGHWRNQPYGAKHALRKKLFIQPYWKGPDDAEELLNRIRQVGKQKSLGSILAESEEIPVVGSAE